MPRQSFRRQRRSPVYFHANENYPFPEHLKIPSSTSEISINAKSNTGPVPSPRVTMDANFFKVKTACLRKILDSIVPATGDFLEKLFLDGVHDSKKVAELKKLRTALKDQFARAEESFLDVPLDDTVFSSASTCFQEFVSFDKLAKFAKSAEKAVDHVLSESEKFLKGEFSVEPPARPGKYPGRDPASTAARPGKYPGRDPASTAARPGKTRQVPRQRPGKYPGKTQQQHHTSIAS
jgi:hypothetical protein